MEQRQQRKEQQIQQRYQEEQEESEEQSEQLEQQQDDLLQSRSQLERPKYDMVLQVTMKQPNEAELITKLKKIYAELIEAEKKCTTEDKAALPEPSPAIPRPRPNFLNDPEWVSMSRLHSKLLHLHQDFLFTTQHPNASDAIRKLVSDYHMPLRIWQYCVQPFFHMLRAGLPATREHLFTFVNEVYNTIVQINQRVPAHSDTWMFYLACTAELRMTVERVHDEIELWRGIARRWYAKCTDLTPADGELYHRLDALAIPVPLQQMFLSSKSLCVANPFLFTREIAMPLFFQRIQALRASLPPLEVQFIKSHSFLFADTDLSEADVERYKKAKERFIETLDARIAGSKTRFSAQGYQIAMSNCAALVEYGSKDSAIMKGVATKTAESAGLVDTKRLIMAEDLANETLLMVIRRIQETSVFAFLHVTLAFLYWTTKHPAAFDHVKRQFPWKPVIKALETLLNPDTDLATIRSNNFPVPESNAQPLPEDYALRGVIWAEGLFPADWFLKGEMNQDERLEENWFMAKQRTMRILWLACRIAVSKAMEDFEHSEAMSRFKYIDAPYLGGRA
ncbi:hypothetical protein B7494_g8416 [Chlorociboria aeruginascens]|nr:hypothetical protein B7494_g8416 [Chlorociboria aeruginascens]